MKVKRGLIIQLTVFFLCIGTGYSNTGPETLYYGAESQGILCGYSQVKLEYVSKNSKKMLRILEEGEVKLTALGAPYYTKFCYNFLLDPASGQYVYYTSDYSQQESKVRILIEIIKNQAFITWQPQGKKSSIKLSPDCILPNYQIYPHLTKYFSQPNTSEKTFQVLDLRDAELHEVTYTRLASEFLNLNGTTYSALVLAEHDLNTGQKAKLWLNPENGYRLKKELPNRTIFLADKSVRNRIKAVSMDDKLVTKVDVIIPDVREISYMQVQTILEPRGLRATPDSLNVPGQTFYGTVNDNRISGIFEISYEKYTGIKAPPFPPDFQQDPELKEFLQAGELIESDDPVLIKKALEITKKASDSWEALKLLSRWVAEEIIYDIPGGLTARSTYDLRRGKCDTYSLLLAAFCRAVGIPARVVWGGMYTPHYGGSFIQHAWNEIYMGEAGWIAVDTTAEEIDHIDSSHIRIGLLSSKTAAFNPIAIEILDYKPQPAHGIEPEKSAVPEKFHPYLGEYRSETGPYKDKTMQIKYANSCLAIEIPGRGVLELKEPDQHGSWYFKVTRMASLFFAQDGAGKVTGLELQIRTRLPKKKPENMSKTAAPKKFQPYLGKYPVPMEGFELEVIFLEDNLAVIESEGEVVKLTGPDKQGLWTYKSNEYKISFIHADNQDVKAMLVHQIYSIPRIENIQDKDVATAVRSSR